MPKEVKETKVEPTVATKEEEPVTELTPYEAMDLVDETQMVNEIEGKFSGDEAMVYSFPDKATGKEITGLSWKGTKAVWWEFNSKGITQMTVTDKMHITQGDTYVDVAVYAYDELRKIGAWGMARGYTVIHTSKGDIEDRFASPKAMSKAQRNALNQLFPMEKVASMLKLFIKQGKMQTLTPGYVNQARQQTTSSSAPYAKAPTQEELMVKFKMNPTQVAPKCPNCGAQMRLAARKDGSGVFWGCINWRTKACSPYNVDEVDIDGSITMKRPQPTKPTSKPVSDIPF